VPGGFDEMIATETKRNSLHALLALLYMHVSTFPQLSLKCLADSGIQDHTCGLPTQLCKLLQLSLGAQDLQAWARQI